MAALYVTSAELKSSLSLSGMTFADQDIDASIASASRAVDQFCGRRFSLDPVNSNVRSYGPTGPLVLIDDLAELGPDGVKVDGTAKTQGSDYVLEPVNNPADGRPWTRVRWLAGYWPAGYGAGWVSEGQWSSLPYQPVVTIMGRWGWATVPPEVKQATQLLANRLLRRTREAVFGVIPGGVDVAGIRIPTIDPDIALLLTPLSLRQRAA